MSNYPVQCPLHAPARYEQREYIQVAGPPPSATLPQRSKVDQIPHCFSVVGSTSIRCHLLIGQPASVTFRQTRHHHRSVSSQSSVDAQIARSMASRHILMRAVLRVYFDVWRLIAYSQKGYALRLCIITLFKCFSCSHVSHSIGI